LRPPFFLKMEMEYIIGQAFLDISTAVSVIAVLVR
jgi:hypothetical protein